MHLWNSENQKAKLRQKHNIDYRNVKKILVITYYWPPSGGAGVQRTLKFVKYFPQFDVRPYVITVDPKKASYPVVDETLLNDVSKGLDIYYTDSFEPLNILGGIVGKNKVPYGGFANKNKETFFQTSLRWIRGNFFIPDARVGWVKYAFEKAVEIIRRENIDTVYVSSPPHSTQLIGLKLKEKFPNIRWIADMRDPWTDIYYYKDLLHTSIAKNIDAKCEKKVLNGADAIIVVSDAIKRTFSNKIENKSSDKIHVIPNGYDESDFINQVEKDKEATYITYVGTMADTYKPEIFFNALKSCIEEYPEKKIKFRFVGATPWTIKEKAKELGIEDHCEWIGHVDHGEAIQYMRKSDYLLLIIPDAPGAEGILTGKLFEYLGAGKAIIGIGPKNGDAAKIIDRCEAGKMFERNEKTSFEQWMKELIKAGVSKSFGNEKVKEYERRQLTKTLTQVLNK